MSRAIKSMTTAKGKMETMLICWAITAPIEGANAAEMLLDNANIA